MKTNPEFKTIDEYIDQFPPDIQRILQNIRDVIRSAAPDSEEKISYRMPAFAQNGILVYFAAFKNHIGFFPTASGVEAFKDELGTLAKSKGTVRFPIDKPLPLDLIKRITEYRVKENSQKIKTRKTGKS